MIVIVEAIVNERWHDGQRRILQLTWVEWRILHLFLLAFAGRRFRLAEHLVILTLSFLVLLDSAEEVMMLSLAPLGPDEVAAARELLV